LPPTRACQKTLPGKFIFVVPGLRIRRERKIATRARLRASEPALFSKRTTGRIRYDGRDVGRENNYEITKRPAGWRGLSDDQAPRQPGR
jgi:hypothetical protein